MFGFSLEQFGLPGLLAAAADTVTNVEATDAGWTISAVPVLVVLAGSVLLFALVRALRGFVPTLPLPRVWRDRLERFGPIAELFLWSIYAAISIAWLLDGNQVATIVMLAALGVVIVVAAFFAIRDYLAGVIVRVERFARVGDSIVIDGERGTVATLGTRYAEIRKTNGDMLLIPYSELGRSSLTRTQRAGTAPRHTFRLSLPDGVDSVRGQQTVYNAALLNHWAAPRHEPVIVPIDTSTLEVTVQPIVAMRADDLEIAVRHAVESLVK